jgi:hypothetical protein
MGNALDLASQIDVTEVENNYEFVDVKSQL